ncbi:hypothetical protein NUW58_g6782 [Xylaria curta]|uniref:Uncharacterized protein n=1 Tax=Xylaria curta TaxID=42375 RepID=A0ACC1NP76_9PEZI|nr:hypothetical protein NUW58_g6782 [Xylaria curta]
MGSKLLSQDGLVEFEQTQEEGVMVMQVRQKAVAVHGGATFAKMRDMRLIDLRTPLPGRVPHNSADNVAAQLIRCLESTVGTEHDLTLSIAWAVLDRKEYGKALGLLRSALSDPRQAYDAGTLAAITLIHRIEVGFDGRTCFAMTSHAAGLYALMAARGPPRLDDELDVHLFFEIMGRMAMYLIMNKEDNIYTHEDWKEVMQKTLQTGIVEHSPYKNLYMLGLHLAQWPDLAIESRRFHLDPSPLWATQIAAKVAKLLEELRDFDRDKIWSFWDTGAMWTVSDLEAPWGEAYHFIDWTTSQVFVMHASISITAARIRAAVLAFLGEEPSMRLEQETLEWSQRIWKSQAYIDRFRIAAMAPVVSLILSYKSATGRAREVILTKLQSVNNFPGRGPVMTDLVLMKACMVATGRPTRLEPYFTQS